MNLFDKVRKVLSFDEWVRLRVVDAVSRTLLPGNRLTWPHLDWFNDETFLAYLRQFSQDQDFNAHRHFALWQLLRMNAGVEGDTAECGVYRGASSWLICAANSAQDPKREHHLFDSFEGLSEPEARDGKTWNKGHLAAGEDLVARNLERFGSQLRFHKGWIPERFHEVADRKFSFVHIDVDLHQPTFDSIAFFYERMSPGGMIVCDDYGFGTCPGATQAVDSFLADKPEKMIYLANGAGVMIKGVETTRNLDPLAPTAA